MASTAAGSTALVIAPEPQDNADQDEQRERAERQPPRAPAHVLGTEGFIATSALVMGTRMTAPRRPHIGLRVDLSIGRGVRQPPRDSSAGSVAGADPTSLDEICGPAVDQLLAFWSRDLHRLSSLDDGALRLEEHVPAADPDLPPLQVRQPPAREPLRSGTARIKRVRHHVPKGTRPGYRSGYRARL